MGIGIPTWWRPSFWRRSPHRKATSPARGTTSFTCADWRSLLEAEVAGAAVRLAAHHVGGGHVLTDLVERQVVDPGRAGAVEEQAERDAGGVGRHVEHHVVVTPAGGAADGA